MGIQNGLGVTGYRRTQSPPSLLEGAPADFETPITIPMRNALAAQVTNLAIGTYDTDTDAVGVQITLPDGTVVTHTVTRASSVPVDASAAAVALAALVNGDDDLLGHVEATTSTTNVILTFLHENVVYPVTATASAGTSNTETEPTAPGGSAIPFGRFVAQGATRDGVTAMRLLTSADTEDDVVGVSMRPIAQFPNAGSELSSAVDGIPAGKMGDAGIEKRVAMRNNGSVASAIGGVVHVVIDDAGGDEVGEARADSDDGGTAQVATVTPTAGQNSVTVSIAIDVLTGPAAGQTATLIYQTDGSMTATEVCDAFRTDFNLSTLADYITDSGTATLILTADDPETTFEVRVVEGLFTIDNATTAAAANTIALPRSRASWAEVVAAGAVGAMSLHMI